MAIPIFILAGQSNAANLSSEVESALDSRYGCGNYELVRVYKAGAPLTRARQDKLDWSDPSEMQSDLVSETIAALNNNNDRVVGGVLWVQGEADTYSVGDADNYCEQLEALIDIFRGGVTTAMGSRETDVESAPFSILELSNSAPDAAGRSGWDTIISEQREVALGDPSVTTLDPDIVAEESNMADSSMFYDGLHYSSDASVLLADALSQSMNSPDYYTNPSLDDGVNAIVVTIDGDGIQLQQNASNQYEILDGIASQAVTYAGSVIGPDSLAGWRAMQAIADGNEDYLVLWQNATEGFAIWDVDLTGAWTGSHNDNLIEFEDRFAFDINGDGEIGHFSTDIDTTGIGLQVSTEDGYRIVDGADTLALQFRNATAGPERFAGWEATHAGSDGAGGYNVLWANEAGAYSIWDVDLTGAWTGSHNDNLIEFEDCFAFDINGDGEIGFF